MSDEFPYIQEQIRHLAVPIDSINLDPKNANKHGPQSLSDIRGSLTEYGQDIPIVCNRKTRNTIKGNGRLQAARELGWKHIAVLFVDESEAKSLGRAIADNRSNESSEWDYNVLKDQLEQINVEDAELRAMLDRLADEAGQNQEPEEDEESEPDGTPKLLANQMELQFGEHYDYILVLFRNAHDWNRACSLLQLKEINNLRRNKSMGLGRGVRGEKLLEILEGRKESQQEPGQDEPEPPIVTSEEDDPLFGFSDQ
jgi:hypothetical protein